MTKPYDIFISYAHLDNTPLDGDVGVVTRLERYVTTWASQKVGDQIKVFMDTELRSGQLWEKTLIEAIRTSKIFMPVISASWINSLPSQAEWRQFWNERVDTATPETIPVIPVTFELTNPWEQMPADLKQVQVSCHFSNGMSDEEFRAAAVRLCGDIADRLRRLKSLTAKQRVFMGLALTEEMKQWRDKLERELCNEGFAVHHADYSFEMDARAFTGAVVEEASGCAAAVHLIGTRPGPYLDGAQDRSLLELQIEALAKPEYRTFAWAGPEFDGTKLEQPRYREFVEGTRYSKETVGQFAAKLIRELKAPPAVSKKNIGKSTVPTVCLICESGDDVANEIRAFFSSRKGWLVTVPNRNVDQRQMTRSYDDAFRVNEHFLFYWGKGDQDWLWFNHDSLVTARMEDGQFKEPRAIALYCAEKQSPEKELFTWRWDDRKLPRYDRFDGQALKQFIEQIEQGLQQ